MTDSHLDWWMDASCRWHQGRPPPGWWRAANGRWYPTGHADQTEQIEVGPPAGGAHFAGGGRGGPGETYRGWSPQARLGALIAAALVALGAVGALAAATADDPDDDRSVAVRRHVSTTSTAPGSTPPPSGATTAAARATPTDGPATVAEPSTTGPPRQPDGTSTTVTADPETPPPTDPPTGPPTSDTAERLRAPCSPEGATALAEDGVPMSCTRRKCHGAPYDQPRWRPTTC